MTTHPTGTGTVVGSLRATGGTAVVRMEDHFTTDADDLWSALAPAYQDQQRRLR